VSPVDPPYCSGAPFSQSLIGTVPPAGVRETVVKVVPEKVTEGGCPGVFNSESIANLK